MKILEDSWGCYKIRQDSLRCLKILWVFWDPPLKILWDALGFFKILGDASKFFEMLQDSWRFFGMLQSNVKDENEDPSKRNLEILGGNKTMKNEGRWIL